MGVFSFKETIFRKGRIDRYYWNSDSRLFNEGFSFPYENFIINVFFLFNKKLMNILKSILNLLITLN
jgi:hypothetical protein